MFLAYPSPLSSPAPANNLPKILTVKLNRFKGGRSQPDTGNATRTQVEQSETQGENCEGSRDSSPSWEYARSMLGMILARPKREESAKAGRGPLSERLVSYWEACMRKRLPASSAEHISWRKADS